MVSFSHQGLSFVLILLDLDIVFSLFLKQLVHLLAEHFAFALLLGHEVGAFGEFHLEGGVLLLVLLVLLQQCPQLLDLLVLLLQGGLYFGYHLPLLSQFSDVHLVGLQLVQHLKVLTVLPHPFIFKIGIISAQEACRRRRENKGLWWWKSGEGIQVGGGKLITWINAAVGNLNIR